MPNDSSGMEHIYKPQTIAHTQMYDYDPIGYAEVNFPIYDIFGRFSRYEVKRMHRSEIEEYNREHVNDKH